MVLDLANEMLKISGGSERTKEQYGINTGLALLKLFGAKSMLVY